ncbi:MAG: CcmD family protein [Chitinophagaceae bacterium]
MSAIKKIIFLFLMIITSLSIFAQQQGAKTTDTMRSNGRIYVVVAVVLTILAGLILYVTRLDRKMSKLEKEN